MDSLTVAKKINFAMILVLFLRFAVYVNYSREADNKSMTPPPRAMRRRQKSPVSLRTFPPRRKNRRLGWKRSQTVRSLFDMN